MSRHPFPPRLRFGTEILFTAETMRLAGEPTDEEGVYHFGQTLRSRGYRGIKGQSAEFVGPGWPGSPVPLEWSPSRAASFPLEPTPKMGAIPQRLRRMLADPLRGMVIGVTDRSEGTIIGHALRPPSRTIRVLEVAVAVSSGTARVILVHPQDAQPVPRPRTSP